MAYQDMSANWAYKTLITYQDLNQLGDNDKTHNHDGTNTAAPAVDNSTIEHSGGVLQLKDDGVTGAKLAAAVAGSGLTQDGSGNLDIESGGITTNMLGVTASFNASVTRYLHVNVSAFASENGAAYDMDGTSLKSADTNPIYAIAPVLLPNGAVVTNLKVYWNRTDATAAGVLDLRQIRPTDANNVQMATTSSDSSAGYHNTNTSSISSATIDNTLYNYKLGCTLTPNTAATDVFIMGVLITYTVTVPLP